ncbi:MAG: hypothetical protein EON92_16690 [Burkholderiales bacterium]|nr:MAG: hypothetical protein EON92_16690 [Burkholderiales bacterium]
MRVQPFEELSPIEPVRPGFRSGGIQFHDLMAGTDGDPGNYGLQLVDVHDAFATPRHRHNFEQVRVMLDGSFGFGPGQVQHKGSVGYFCEGTYYTQAAQGRSTTLLLQLGGPSRQGFMSRSQLRRGIDSLATRGEFAQGIYTWVDGHGKKHNQDSYEAVWEFIHGKPVEYSKPQYQGPVLMEPERFAWRTTGPAASLRELGTFNGFGLQLAQLRIAAGGKHVWNSGGRAQLLFCLEGQGEVNGVAYRRWTTLNALAGEQLLLAAAEQTLFFVFYLPSFDA